MQGRQEFQPELFSEINLEALIPQNHLLRKIDRVLDLSFVRELTAPFYCDNNGRPSVDPELFFRIQLITYLYDIPSDRRVCEELQFNLAYKWFCRLSVEGSVPDHSSLTRIRDRMGEQTYKEIFERLIKSCIEKKILKVDKIMMDGSMFRADAAISSLVEKDENGKPSKVETAKYIKGQKYSNDTHISATDPDSTLAGKPSESKKLSYKAHVTIDRDTRMVIDPFISTGSAMEGKIYLGRIDYIEKTFDTKIKELTADRGYGSGENLKALFDQKIISFVPRFRSTAGDHVARDSEGFSYDKKRDCFTCPQGHDLHPMQSAPNVKRYRIKGGHCRTCPIREKCLNLKAMRTRAAKHIDRSVFHEYMERAALLETGKEFKDMRSERQWKMEGSFAEAKNYHGLERARYRGRAKVQIQCYMIAFVQNLKRLVGLAPLLAHLILKRLNKYFEKIAEKLFVTEFLINFSCS